ncbi:heme ABC exporter ATP-binding protein CcmA [Parvularcula oceani]|uniref:heme ABC exporter ATP-binding protein CcmA n=1 Tax=Parvularcula oceani TaxID=1247963 RepID=UPI0004E162A8|nr:heme ABC exporter ATP-binding protein CcmA [Parvularcula oceani]
MGFAVSLSCSDIAPSRGGRIVASGVSFHLAPGDALLLRGPNGSGKSSVLRAVAGLATLAGGDIRFEAGGTPCDPAETRARGLHLLAAGEGLADRLTAAEHIAFWSGLYAAEPGDVLADAGLSGSETIPAGKLSTGQRRRLGLARLLLAPRPVWLLDEPLSGLDAEGRSVLLDAAAAHRGRGGLVLMATHEGEGLPGAPTLRLSAP